MSRNKHITRLRLTVLLAATGFVCLCATTACTSSGTMTVARVDPSTTQSQKPKQDASGKHRHDHCHMKGNGKNEVCHDHPHDGGTHH